MQIWLADLSFELILPPKKTKKEYLVVEDVVCKKVPEDHLNKNTDIIKRATISISDSRMKDLAKDVRGRFKVTVTYKKRLGVTNEENG